MKQSTGQTDFLFAGGAREKLTKVTAPSVT